MLFPKFRLKGLALQAVVLTTLCASATLPIFARADHSASSKKAASKTSKSQNSPQTSVPGSANQGLAAPAVRGGAVDRSGAANRAASALPSRGAYITRTAEQFKGMPYVWGGTSPRSGFDCSGFVQYVYSRWGIYLPRCASEQVSKGVPVKPDQLQAGDLVFFKNTYRHGLSHVGIYVGDGWFIHAASARNGVMLSRLDSGYHKKHWYGARRLDLSKLPAVAEESQEPVRVVLEEPAPENAADAGAHSEPAMPNP